METVSGGLHGILRLFTLHRADGAKQVKASCCFAVAEHKSVILIYFLFYFLVPNDSVGIP